MPCSSTHSSGNPIDTVVIEGCGIGFAMAQILLYSHISQPVDLGMLKTQTLTRRRRSSCSHICDMS
ncbi:unnamed protein product [Mycena citricolor]|uniref:Uncharacterized protein n=1 Tax=Mycena citricolor TaxID=2018698 RepID=A0AAD2HNG6_9AGAR|nr:unnamed protein product [Mycena citricolor]